MSSDPDRYPACWLGLRGSCWLPVAPVSGADWLGGIFFHRAPEAFDSFKQPADQPLGPGARNTAGLWNQFAAKKEEGHRQDDQRLAPRKAQDTRSLDGLIKTQYANSYASVYGH